VEQELEIESRCSNYVCKTICPLINIISTENGRYQILESRDFGSFSRRKQNYRSRKIRMAKHSLQVDPTKEIEEEFGNFCALSHQISLGHNGS
jgi:hypothetical protein